MLKFYVKNGWICVNANRHALYNSGINGAKWNRRGMFWMIPLTKNSVQQIMDHQLFRGAEFPKEFSEIMSSGVVREKIKDATEFEPVPFTKFPAWEHQLRAYHYLKLGDSALLDYGMGTGKTKVIVDFIANEIRPGRTLIICPVSVLPVWPAEFAKHLHEKKKDDFVIVVCGSELAEDADYTGMKIVLAKGTTKKRAATIRTMESIAKATKKKFIVVINYESIWREGISDYFTGNDWELIVCDESHRIKTAGSTQSMFVNRLGKKASKRVCLSGTPTPNSPLDVYGQFRFLDPTVFGSSYARFRQRYAVMGGFKQHEVVGYCNERELNEKFHSLTVSCGREVLDLPGSVIVPKYCELGAEARRVYRDLRDKMVAEIEDGTVTASNALAKLLRLQQITSGFIPVEREGDEEAFKKHIDSSKINLLEEQWESVGWNEPITVFCRFTHDLDMVRKMAEKHGADYCEQSGRLKQWTEFKAGRHDLIGVQIQSGGLGIDLTRSAFSFMYSVGYSLGDFEQAICRVDRPGQTRFVRIIPLVARGTVDEKLYTALDLKKKVIEYIIRNRNW